MDRFPVKRNARPLNKCSRVRALGSEVARFDSELSTVCFRGLTDRCDYNQENFPIGFSGTYFRSPNPQKTWLIVHHRCLAVPGWVRRRCLAVPGLVRRWDFLVLCRLRLLLLGPA